MRIYSLYLYLYWHMRIYTRIFLSRVPYYYDVCYILYRHLYPINAPVFVCYPRPGRQALADKIGSARRCIMIVVS